jgi:hypothetical protein
MKKSVLLLILNFVGAFHLGSNAQKLWPIEKHQGSWMVQAGPNHSEAWLGIGSGPVLPQLEADRIPMPYSATFFLPLTWVDIRNLVRVYETDPQGIDSTSYICLEALENWQFKTECFELTKGNWSFSLSRDARPTILLRSAGILTQQEQRVFLQSLPCPPQDSLCRRLAMPSLISLLQEMDSLDSRGGYEYTSELLHLQHQLQAFLENGAGKTLLDFRRTTQAQAFFTDATEINALWQAYGRLAKHYLEVQQWGPALMLLNNLKRLRPNDETIQSMILQAEKAR